MTTKMATVLISCAGVERGRKIAGDGSLELASPMPQSFAAWTTRAANTARSTSVRLIPSAATHDSCQGGVEPAWLPALSRPWLVGAGCEAAGGDAEGTTRSV